MSPTSSRTQSPYQTSTLSRRSRRSLSSSLQAGVFIPLLMLSLSVGGCGNPEGETKEPGAEDGAVAGVSGAVTPPTSGDALAKTAAGAGQSSPVGQIAAPPKVPPELEGLDLGLLITSQTQLYEYVQATISSAIEGIPSSLGAEKPGQGTGSLLLASGPAAPTQSTQFPLCSNEGDPWDSAQKKRLDPTVKEFAQYAFYCQLNASDSRKTVRGALDQNRRLLCDIEESLGSLAYDPKEKTYSGLTINLSTACGWTAQSLSQFGRSQITGSVRTQALGGGDWQKKLVLDFPGSIVMTLYVAVTKTSVSFKEIQGWKKIEEKTSNQYLAQNAEGSHGHVIQLDYANGILRAETADTYWGRRVRLVAKGTIDAATGRFTKVDTLNGLYSRFNKAGDEGHTHVDNAVATVAGNAVGGFAYLSGLFNCPQDAACNPNNEELFSLTILNLSRVNCVPLTAKCDGNNGLPITFSPEVLNYLMVGAAWDDQVQKRTQFDKWLSNAGIPKFNTVDYSVVLPN